METSRIPVIETARLILRGPTTVDADVYATFLGEPDFARYMPRSKATTTRTLQERATRMIGIYQERWQTQPLSAMGWSITKKDNGQFIGLGGIEETPGTTEGEVDYRLGKPFWGQGFATETARAMIRFGFEHTQWDRMTAAVVPANIASSRVLDHLGFVFEKLVNYNEMTGNDSIELDDPIVALYVLRREKYQPDTALYRLVDAD